MDILPPTFHLSAANAPKTPTAEEKADQLRQAAEGFESLFVQELLKAGRAASLAKDELTGGSAVETAQSMLDAEFAKVSSGNTNLGIAQAIYRQFEAHVTGRKS